MGFLFESQEQLNESLAIWQKELRLQDWEIEAAVKPSYKMFTVGSQASIEWSLNEKTAVIHLLDPEEYPPGTVREQDHEVSLVHELIHLHYAPFEDTANQSLEHSMMELSIDVLSNTLVRLRRQGVAVHE